MISGDNIQQYINFLHEKRYNAPADETLLSRWKSLNDFEIIQQLQGLYNFWGIDSMTAAMYERLFIQAQFLQQAPVAPAPVAAVEHTHNAEPRSRSALRHIAIGLMVVIIAAATIWSVRRAGTLSESGRELQKRALQTKDSLSRENAIRMQQEQAKQRLAFERARQLKAVKEHFDLFVTQKVRYDYNGFFGGIHDVQVTVSNNSDFKMDAVTVKLSYIKKNGELFDVKYITIPNVPAHGRKTVSGPESKRGTSMESKITSVKPGETEEVAAP